MKEIAVRIAMWSGPRSISTTLMRSWQSRNDTFVTDEPFYACYLSTTGVDHHPGREEVMASQSTDWREVAAWITGAMPEGKKVWYQKHMAHHLLPQMDRKWIDNFVNCFLIRDPGQVLLSYTKTRRGVTPDDLGYKRLAEIFDLVKERTGEVPPVIDARDLLQNPRQVLTLLCERVGIPFSGKMLSWPAGRRETDGVWGKYWYHNLEKSTGFLPYSPRLEPLPEDLKTIYEQSMELYDYLREYRLSGSADREGDRTVGR